MTSVDLVGQHLSGLLTAKQVAQGELRATRIGRGRMYLGSVNHADGEMLALIPVPSHVVPTCDAVLGECIASLAASVARSHRGGVSFDIAIMDALIVRLLVKFKI